MSMTATARPTDGGFRHEVDVNGRHTIVTDEPTALGGTDTGPAPHELLAATIASCVSTMVALYAQRKGWDVHGLSVEVVYDNESEPRKVEVTVNLPSGISADQVTRLQKVADTCPVRRALEAGFEFSDRINLPEAPPAKAA
jgi:putative redox protein